jgi:hypothetical protein
VVKTPLGQIKKYELGAEPRIGLLPAVQQGDALPTEQWCTQARIFLTSFMGNLTPVLFRKHPW